MPFLRDLLFYNSGNECPENYIIFAGLATASAVCCRRAYIDWPPNRLYPNIYPFLIGDQGSRKGVAKQVMFHFLLKDFPLVPRGASTTSPQAITKKLASQDCIIGFKDENDVYQEAHVLVFCVGELKHFLGLNQSGMIDLFTDAYDEIYLEADYKNTGNDPIPNPYLVLLACETPDWILTRLKTELISGGFARRIIPVYEKEKRCAIPSPFVTPDMEKARERCVADLQKLEQKFGRVSLSPDAAEYYSAWYIKHEKNPPSDPLAKGFHSSQHAQVLKIGCLLTLLERDEMVMDLELLQVSISLIDRIVPGMLELFSGAGRNQLALPTKRLVQWIEAKGGRCSEKDFRLFADRDMDPREVEGVIKHLFNTEQIFPYNESRGTITRKMFALPDYYKEKIVPMASKSASVAATPSAPATPPAPTTAPDSAAVSGPPSAPSANSPGPTAPSPEPNQPLSPPPS